MAERGVRCQREKPGRFIALCDGERNTKEENEAHARLIVAAPDLLKALIEVRLLVPSGSEAMGIIDEACGKAGVEPWRCKVPATEDGRGK